MNNLRHNNKHDISLKLGILCPIFTLQSNASVVLVVEMLSVRSSVNMSEAYKTTESTAKILTTHTG